MNEKNKQVLANIIAAVESGGQVYSETNKRWTAYAGKYANTINEVTCTLGCYQAYGDEAQELIQYIYDNYPDTFRGCDPRGLIEAKLSVSWTGTQWGPSPDQKACLIAMLGTEAGHEAQEVIFRSRMDKYLARAEAFGVKTVGGQMMWAEVQHLGGKDAPVRVFTRCKGDYSVDHILDCLNPKYADLVKYREPVEHRKFWTRHVKCAEFIKKYAQEENSDAGKDTDKMGVTASKVIQRAQHFIGYREKNHSWANMEDFTADAGSGNYQRFQPIAGAGNGDQWCQYFVDAIMVEVCGSIAEAKRMLCQTNSGNYMTGYTPDGSNYFKQAGRWYTVPEVGDVIYFYSSSMGRICHVGYVEAVDKASKIVYTIEGNTNSDGFATNGGCVARHSYSFAHVGGGNRVAGFGRPRYTTISNDKTSREGYTVFAFGDVSHRKDDKFRSDDYVLQTILRGRGFKGKDGKELKLDGKAQENTMFAAEKYMDARASQGVDLGERSTWGAKCWADVFGRKAI